MAEFSAAREVAGSHRITSLDSLRGIAALIVVFHHLDNTLDPDGTNALLEHWVHETPLRLLIDGRCAVMLFFVLSGFALSISIGKKFNYWTYFVRRVCRLMVPCIAGILLAAGMYLLVQPVRIPELGSWFNDVLWNRPVTWGLVARHILMTGAQEDSSLNNVLWSLVVELRISLIFPLLYFVVKGRTKWAVFTAFCMQFLFRYFVIQSDNYVPFFNKNVIQALENIGYYVPFFVAGIVARENMDAIRRIIAQVPKWVVLLVLIAALRLEESGVDIQIGIGAFLVIVICVGAPFISNALSIAPIEWLGRISYSLYLVHLVLLATLFHLFYGKVNSYILAAGVVFGSLALAQVFYWLIEKPSIHLGRWLTAKRVVAPVVAANVIG